MKLFINAFKVRWDRYKSGDRRGVYLSRQLRALLMEIREYYGLTHRGRKGTAYLVNRCLDEERLLKEYEGHNLYHESSIHEWNMRDVTQDALHMVYDLPYSERRRILSCTGPHCRKRILIDLARITKVSPEEMVSITNSMLAKYTVEELRDLANGIGKLQEKATALAIHKRFGGE